MTTMRLTARLRLTLTYLGLFVALGAGLLLLNYQLLSSQLTGSGAFVSTTSGSLSTSNGAATVTASSALVPGLTRIVDRYRGDALHKLLQVSGISLIAATVLGGVLVWLVARRTLRPLLVMNRTATRISEQTLDQRLPITGPRDELRDLSETFNAMLDRLSAAFAHERRLVANASHELGTPIANQRALLEVTLEDDTLSVAELRTVCSTVLDQTIRAEQLLRGMLTIARADQAELRTTVVRLDEAVTEAIAAAHLEDLIIHRDLTASSVAADPFLLERLLANLLANAGRHNLPQGWVRVELTDDEGQLQLRVSNSCRPIDAGLRDHLAEPFRRGTAARTGSEHGNGLGLSIVQAIASAHGWHLDLRPGEATFEATLIVEGVDTRSVEAPPLSSSAATWR